MLSVRVHVGKSELFVYMSRLYTLLRHFDCQCHLTINYMFKHILEGLLRLLFAFVYSEKNISSSQLREIRIKKRLKTLMVSRAESHLS